MKQNGAEVIHFATGFVVGYPPCPHIDYFREFIMEHYGLKVVIGTHPIPQKYLDTHSKLGTWESKEWTAVIEPVMANKELRLAYN